ncbi:MAG: winged helix-turn-helix transcriptional regulator [Longimicrobiales bacterium]
MSTRRRVAVGHLLAEELRELEADGMIDRERTGEPPAPVMCSLTGYGYSVVRNEEHP